MRKLIYDEGIGSKNQLHIYTEDDNIVFHMYCGDVHEQIYLHWSEIASLCEMLHIMKDELKEG